LVFGLVFELLGINAQLTRRKLGKIIHPNHGGRQRPTAAMVTPPWRLVIRQSSNTMCDKSMSIKLENIIVFTLFISYAKALRIVDARAEQTPNYHTLAAPMSISQPPQPRGTADLIFWRWRVTLAAMDGGVFVASPLVGNIGKARGATHLDGPTRRPTNAELLPPPAAL
jgi:hypothetical protein